MSLVNNCKFLLAAAIGLTSTASMAASQGTHMYYGVGGSILKDDDTNFNITAAASLIFGIEENGWGLEGILFASQDSVLDDPTNTFSDLQYNISGQGVTLNYRTIEDKSGSYYKFKYGTMDVDYDLKGQLRGTLESEGDVYGLGFGWRLSKVERIELGIDVYDADEYSDDLSILSLNYIYGSAPYNGAVRGKNGENPFYFGLAAGFIDMDINGLDTAEAYNFMAGYELSPSFAFEFNYLASGKAEDKLVPNDAWIESTFSTLSAVYKMSLSKRMYTKFKLGYGQDVFEVNVFGLKDSSSDSLYVYGLGMGYVLDSGSKLELEYDVISYTDSDIDISPQTITLSYIF